jgi:tetratricopeptide (TPR) repeat protein/tRNA A-37 threonylcarbamoyl transferase component Bud32
MVKPVVAQEGQSKAKNFYEKGLEARSLSEKIKYFHKAVELDSSFQQGLYYLGITYYQKSDYHNSVEYLQKAVKLDSVLFKKVQPYLINAYNFYAAELIEQESYDEAILIADKAIKVDENFVSAYVILGQAYYYKRDWQASAEALTRATKLDSNQVTAWNYLGKLYLRLGEYDQSVEAFEEALARDPDLKDAQINLNIAIRKNSPDSWLERYEDAAAEGQWLKAIEILKKARTLYPDHSIIETKLSEALLSKEYFEGLRAFEDENWARAVAIFQKMEPTYADVAEKLAMAKVALQKDEDKENTLSKEEFEKAPVDSLDKSGAETGYANIESVKSIHDTTQTPSLLTEAPIKRVSNKSDSSTSPEQATPAERDSLALAQIEQEPHTIIRSDPDMSDRPSNINRDRFNRGTKTHRKSFPVLLTGLLVGVVSLGLVLVTFHKRGLFGKFLKGHKDLTRPEKTQSVEALEPGQKASTTETEEFVKDQLASITPVKFQPLETSEILHESQEQKQENSPHADSDKGSAELQETKTILGGIKRVQRIGRYILEKEIGRGSMGLVYKAWDPKLDRTVVIKQVSFDLHNRSSEAHKLQDRLLREARAAGRLNHPNIVIIYDVDQEESFSYIVMEYLSGQDLRSLLEAQGKFEVLRTIRIIYQICNALSYAHQFGIVHRDIKPSNIILMENDKVKVADFGIAKLPNLGTLTDTGNVLGTPFYMSPEQIEGRKVDGRADIFSVGVLLYEMVTGIRPFDGDNIASVVYKIIHKKPRPLSYRDKNLPSYLDEILKRALAKDPDKRYSSAAKLKADLENLEREFI